MENKILKARLGKAQISYLRWLEKHHGQNIRVSKTKTKKLTKSSRSNKGIKSLAAKQIEQQHQQSEQQQPQPTYNSDLSEVMKLDELSNKR